MSALRRRAVWNQTAHSFPAEIEESMGKSHQAGWVSLRGKQWFGYFRQTVLDPATGEERVKKVCVKLALKTKND